MLHVRLGYLTANDVRMQTQSLACCRNIARVCCAVLICICLHVSRHGINSSSHCGAAATVKPLRVAVVHWGQIAALDWNNEAVLASGSCGSCKVRQYLLEQSVADYIRNRPSRVHPLC